LKNCQETLVTVQKTGEQNTTNLNKSIKQNQDIESKCKQLVEENVKLIVNERLESQSDREENKKMSRTNSSQTNSKDKKEVNFVSMKGTSKRFDIDPYNFNDLKSTDLTTGICVGSGTIMLEFDAECKFDKIQVGGWRSYGSITYISYGANAKISTSKDGIKWTEVGALPSDFKGKISPVNLIKSTAKYIKFQSDYIISLGHLEIIPKI